MRRILAVTAALLCAFLLCLPSEAFAQTALRIGVLNDMSGIYADIAGPGSVTAAHMAVEDFGGSVLGRPIEVLVGDHQNKPDIGAAIAKRWYEREGVGLITNFVEHEPCAIAILDASGVHHDSHWQALGVHEGVQLPAFQL